MQTSIKEIKKDFNKNGYRITSLKAIENRRDRTMLEDAELENLIIKQASLSALITQHNERSFARINRFGYRLTLLSAIVFAGLATFAVGSSFRYVTEESTKNTQFLFGLTIVGTLFLSSISTYYLLKQSKKQTKVWVTNP